MVAKANIGPPTMALKPWVLTPSLCTPTFLMLNPAKVSVLAGPLEATLPDYAATAFVAWKAFTGSKGMFACGSFEAVPIVSILFPSLWFSQFYIQKRRRQRSGEFNDCC